MWRETVCSSYRKNRQTLLKTTRQLKWPKYHLVSQPHQKVIITKNDSDIFFAIHFFVDDSTALELIYDPQEPKSFWHYQQDPDASLIRSVSTRDLISWSFQIARGMDYLANKKVILGSYDFKKEKPTCLFTPRFSMAIWLLVTSCWPMTEWSRWPISVWHEKCTWK